MCEQVEFLYTLVETGDSKYPYRVSEMRVLEESSHHYLVECEGTQRRVLKSFVWLSGNTPERDAQNMYYPSLSRLKSLVLASMRGESELYRVWAVALNDNIGYVEKAIDEYMLTPER